MKFKTGGAYGASSTITHPGTDETVSLDGKVGSSKIFEATDDTLLEGDYDASNPNDAIIYDLTLSGSNALRFEGFTTFDLGKGDDVLDLTVRPANADDAYDLDVFALAGEGDDIVWSGTGNDAIGGDVETLEDGDIGGDDWLTGGRGDDLVLGDSDTIEKGSRGGDDRVEGGPGDDILVGEGNTLRGVGGADTIRGGDGTDVLVGDGLVTEGKGGNDTLAGGDGADTLIGDGATLGPKARGGDDTLRGGAGDDILIGDGGLSGEEGSDPSGGDDLFVFGPDAGRDIILDFGFGEDEIDVRDLGIEEFDDLDIEGNGTESVEIAFDEDNSVVVSNFDATSIRLTEDDFLFA